MKIEFRVDESIVNAAWLATLYDLIEELNCRCATYLEETYNKSYKNYNRTRVIEVCGSDTMISWLKLRMERYDHCVNSFNNRPEIKVISDKDDD